MSSPHAEFIARHPEPPAEFWRQPETYGTRLEEDFLLPLQAEMKRSGSIPLAMQFDVLYRLHWYFTVDGRERAPTAIVSPATAPPFLARISEIMGYIEPKTVLDLVEPPVTSEVRLLLYAWNAAPGCTVATVTACDHARQLIQVRYYVHGMAPSESWLLDGREIDPAYEKYRACRYYYRNFLQQRIVWLPVSEGKLLQLRLNGCPHLLQLDPLPENGWAEPAGEQYALRLDEVRTGFWFGQGGRKNNVKSLRKRLKARLMRIFAHLPPVRARFRDAWVLVDRNENADDNAEHLYRWLKKNHPEINIWFLLNSDAPDWKRLVADGFRLMPPGMMRKLLLLNSKHIISSHAEYVHGGFDKKIYGSLLKWKFSYLRHGVGVNDQSSWLGPKNFDFFVTSSPAERSSMVDSGNNYAQTTREVRLTGLPRHDRLLQTASQRLCEQPRRLLVMPTWRGGSFEEQARNLPAAERSRLFATTEYALAWGAFLRDVRLHVALQQHRWKLVFMPHLNTLPYVDVFSLPPQIEVVSLLNGGIQQHLAAASAFLTDYTSVAFDFALLRRPVFYFQFDRDSFYGGGHNWRPGYFDYDRDGFGPVAFNPDDLVSILEQFFVGAGEVEPQYLTRMQQAMPLNDGLACQRVFDSIAALDRPWQKE